MYVFISENCRKEARKFGLEAKIDEIARQIERLNYHEFTMQAEKFEHPFYVKKQVAYNYRLLIKIVDFEVENKHHQVAVFFKVFNRSNKGYDDFYYHVIKQGNILYHQQDIDKQLNKYIQHTFQKRDIKNTKVMNKDDGFGYFFQIKTDILQLCALIEPEHYYKEDCHWVYGIRPYLADEEFCQVFDVMQSCMNMGQSQMLTVSSDEIYFKVLDNPLLTSKNPNNHFLRLLPQECLFDKTHWHKLQMLDLPIYFNDFQKHIITHLFDPQTSFPLIINAPNNHGKSSLSAILAIHLISQPNWKNHGVLPCLFLCNSQQKNQIKQQLMQYVAYYHQYISPLPLPYDELALLIDECCHDMVSYIQCANDDEYQIKFCQEKMIDFDRFVQLWQSSSLFLKNKYQDYPVSLIWYVIYYLIKGKQGDFDEIKDLQAHHIHHDDYMVIYQNIYKGWYEPLQKQGFWDLQDLVLYANNDAHHMAYASLIIDDAEHYTKLDIEFLLKNCYWYHKEGLINQAPLLFLGNHHGVGHYFYDWHHTLTSWLHEMLDSFNEICLLQPAIMDYPADFLNPLQCFLHIHRQKLSIAEPFNLGSDNTKLLEQKVYFIDVNNKQVVHALFGNKTIPIIIRATRQKAEQYLIDNDFDGIFDYMKPSEGGIHFLSLGEAHQKYQHIALFGFFDDELSSLFDDKSMADLSVMQKLNIDERLKDIHQALNCALSHVFVIGRVGEYELCQEMFSHQFVQMAMLEDISANYVRHQHFLEKANKDNSKDELIKRAEWLFNHAYYTECMKTLMLIAHINKNYEHYFEFIHGEGQKIFTLSYLWKYKNRHALSLYVKYFKDNLPKEYMGNCHLIAILAGEPLAIPKVEALNVIFHRYLMQYKDKDWGEFWVMLLDEFIQRLPEFELTDKEYQNLCAHLGKLVQKNTPHIYHYLAQCHYYLNHDKVAFNYWRQSKERGELSNMPLAYHELLVQYGNSWQEKLISHIYLEDLGAVMNMLSTNNLNELQASYWEKILPFLDDVQELQTVIASLLPDIHNPEILQRIYDYCQDSEDIAGEFENRLQRLLSVQACFSGDWQYVSSRILYYKSADLQSMRDKLSQAFNIQHTNAIRVNKKGMIDAQKSTRVIPVFDKPQNELVDIIYALSLNDKVSAFKQQNHHDDAYQGIQSVFESIKEIFATKADDETYWNVDFPAVRALACLIEKSNHGEDIFDFYRAMTMGQKHHRDFAWARLSIYGDEWLSDEYQDTTALGDFYQKIHKFYQDNKVMLAKHKPANLDNKAFAPLKSKEEIVKSVLALTDKEHKEIQRLKKLEQEYLKEQARLEKERLENERLEQERLQKEKQEKERLAQLEQKEQERRQQEQLEKEKQEKEKQARLEQERLEKERLEKERLAQEKLAQERLAQEQAQQKHISEQQKHQIQSKEENDASIHEQGDIVADKTFKKTTRPHRATQMVSTFEFFGWRVFVARLYGRVNIEDLATGERFSVQVHDGLIQSDWHYHEEAGSYHLEQTPLVIEVAGNMVFINHLEHGVSLTIRL